MTCPEIAYIADLYWWLHTSAMQVHGQYQPYKCMGSTSHTSAWAVPAIQVPRRRLLIEQKPSLIPILGSLGDPQYPVEGFARHVMWI